MLFILFDVEAVFLYPWAVILRDLKHFGLWEMFVYIGIVLVGYFISGRRAYWIGARPLCEEENVSGAGAAITDLEQLKGHPAVARLLAWKSSGRDRSKIDRDEMTIYVDRDNLHQACSILRDDAACAFNFLSDVTCVDWYPAERALKWSIICFRFPRKSACG